MVAFFALPFFAGASAYTYFRWDALTETLTEVAEEEFNDAVDRGAEILTEEAGRLILKAQTFLSSIDWVAIGEAVGNAASEVIKATAEVSTGFAKTLIPDLIEGAETGFSLIAAKLDGTGPIFIAGFTIFFLVIMTMIYIYSEVRRGK
jgi:hypothetical protein